MNTSLPESLNPDDKPIYEALREAGVRESMAYTAVQRLRDMAAANLIAQVMARLDSQNAMIAAQNAKLNMLMWMVGAAVALIGIIVRLWG